VAPEGSVSASARKSARGAQAATDPRHPLDHGQQVGNPASSIQRARRARTVKMTTPAHYEKRAPALRMR
jgi:hypothetical protein